VKQLADQQRSFFGAKPLPAGGAPAGDVTFRRRRLTFATQGNITPHTPLHQIQQRVFRSLEIGDVPKVSCRSSHLSYTSHVTRRILSFPIRGVRDALPQCRREQ
jgi:hypothetical protein